MVVPLAGFAPKRPPAGDEDGAAFPPNAPPNMPPEVAGFWPNIPPDVAGAAVVVVLFPNRAGFDASAPVVAGFAPKENDGVEDAPPAAAPPPNGLAAGLDVPLVALPKRPPAAGFAAPPKRLPDVLVV